MTQEEIKKMDRRVRLIQDPFGTGFPTLYKTLQEMSEYKGKALIEIIRQYFVWKYKSS